MGVRDFGAFLFLTLIGIATACGSDGDDNAGLADAGTGGASGAGAGNSTGATSSGGRSSTGGQPSLPPPEPPICAGLGLEYAGGGCTRCVRFGLLRL